MNYASDGVAKFETGLVSTLNVGRLRPRNDSTLAIDGPVLLSGTFALSPGSSLDLGANDIGRHADAGKVAYRGLGTADALSIVGAGTSVGTRKVRVVDRVDVGNLVSLDGAYRCGGLAGEYFSNTLLNDPPACQQTDATINFNWPGSGPCIVCGGAIGCTGWSARWTGYVRAPLTGVLTIGMTSDDGFRLWWGGSALPIMAAWTDQSASFYSVNVSTVAGEYYALRLEYYQAVATYWASLNLYYYSGGITPIPSDHFCTASGVQVTSGMSTFNGEVTFKAPALFKRGIGGPRIATAVHGALSVGGSATFADSVEARTLTIGGASLFRGPIGLSDDDDFIVNATSSFGAPVTLSSAARLTADGPSTFWGAVNFGNASVSGNGNVGVAGSLSVLGSAVFASAVRLASATVGGHLNVTGDLTVGGLATFGASGLRASAGDLNVNSPLVLSSASPLSVLGSATFAGPVNFGSATVAGNGNVGVGKNLTVFGYVGTSGLVSSAAGGIVQVASPLALIGGSGLSVSGDSNFSGAANFGTSGPTYVTGAGNVGIGGTLRVTGLASFANGIGAVSGTLNVYSPVSLTGVSSLTVGGVSTFQGAANFGSSTVTGNGNVGVGGSLSVAGSSTFAGLATFGQVDVTGGLDVDGNGTVAGAFRTLSTTSLSTPITITGSEMFDITVSSGTYADVGRDMSIAIDPADGLAIIPHYDNSNRDLRIAKCSNADCTASTNLAVDWTNDVGQFTSVATKSGFPTMIAYADITVGSRNLRVAICQVGDPLCLTPVLRTVDSVSADVGTYTSCAYGSDNLLMIAYRDATNAQLKVAHCNDTLCTTAVLTTLAPTATVNGHMSLAYNPNDQRVVIGYHDDDIRSVRLAHCSNVVCSTATLATVANAVAPGTQSRISIAISGTLPLITFFRNTTYGLVLFQCATTACTSFGTQRTIDALATHLAYPTIAVPPGGFPYIVYTLGGLLRLARCNDAICASVTIRQLLVSASQASMAIGTDNFPIIPFFFTTSTKLGVVHCTTAACDAPVITNTITNTSRQSLTISRRGRPLFTVDETGAVTANSLRVTTLTATTLTVTTSQSMSKFLFGRNSGATANEYYFDSPFTNRQRVTLDITGCAAGTYCHDPKGVISYYMGATGTPSYVALNLLGVPSYQCGVIHVDDDNFAGGVVDSFVNGVAGATADTMFGILNSFSFIGVGSGNSGVNALQTSTAFAVVCF